MFENKDIAENIVRFGAHHAMSKRYRHPSATVCIDGKSKRTFDVEKQVTLLQSALSFVEACGKKSRLSSLCQRDRRLWMQSVKQHKTFHCHTC